MNKLVTAIALAISLPATAIAQTAAAPAKMACCEKMKAAAKGCGEDMAGMDHSKMDHSKMDHGANHPAPVAQPDRPQNHQR